MSLSQIADVAASGLLAQRLRMLVTASNLANAQTTRTAEGGPYQRRDPVFVARPIGGPFADHLARRLRAVEVPRITVDARPGPLRHDPGHPDADPDGYVRMPNVDPVSELANLLSASRSFEAGVFVMKKVSEMGDAALRIGR
jgi:flagellar basal-body rod protein FlgC